MEPLSFTLLQTRSPLSPVVRVSPGAQPPATQTVTARCGGEVREWAWAQSFKVSLLGTACQVTNATMLSSSSASAGRGREPKISLRAGKATKEQNSRKTREAPKSHYTPRGRHQDLRQLPQDCSAVDNGSVKEGGSGARQELS